GGLPLSVPCQTTHLHLNQSVTLALRPEKITIAAEPLAANMAEPATVVEEIYSGTDTRYFVRLANGLSLIVRMQNGAGANLPAVSVGQQCYVSWPPAAIQLLVD
ncbi:MAG: TOBE domain-containing protein, partial [Caldilineaceae bacterium]|nr:TOBE domain-containing protein [Caldilineaceae bacterium]